MPDVVRHVPVLSTKEALAIHGGTPLRTTPMPPRFALGAEEERMIGEVLKFYRENGLDPGYQGHFEKLYTDAFVATMGGGYADAVSTGTASLYVALAAFSLPEGSEVICSPITDPGTLSAIILNRLVPRLADSAPGSYNMGVEQFISRIGPKVRAVVVVHSIGQAADIEAITTEAHARGILVLEDCSQSHGARHKGKMIGNFGDIAAFSTMYRKTHMTGASGGLVFSRDLDLFRLTLAHADRGKPRWLSDFNDRNPATFLFPALNHHTDEISCGIGIASLARLNTTILRRLAFVAEFSGRLRDHSQICSPYGYSPNDSPFIYPVVVDPERISCTKTEFADAVIAEGIGLNPHYEYVVTEWPWIRQYLADDFDTVNARDIRDRTFDLYVNENYGQLEADHCVEAILKVERYYKR
jgi:dTDP-4-amino-4,6-dideoxygalactose transaminase